MILNSEEKERILLVGVDLGDRNTDIRSSMNELAELVKAADGYVVSEVIQNKDYIDATFFVGKGKAEEIRNYCHELDIDTVVFNDELSGAQLKNLEKVIERKIIDRTNLILDIFAKRATSKEGKLQVELAQLKYRLPRLAGLRDYLSREGGGIGTRGPGEKKAETDRRHILREINNIEKQLKYIEQVREVKRKKRMDSKLPIIALVGYTNAGKSTLLNKIIEMNKDYDTSKNVFVYDMLFATLDTTFRRAYLPNGQEFLITDTVGFVNKLPTHLIEAFKGTLEEVKYADLILHVVDSSSNDLDIQIKTTYKILNDLKVLNKPIINVFNKIDKIDKEKVIYRDNLTGEKIYISAKEGVNLNLLLEMIQNNLPEMYFCVKLLIPYKEQYLLSYFYENYNMEEVIHDEKGTCVKLSLSSIDYEKYKKFIIE